MTKTSLWSPVDGNVPRIGFGQGHGDTCMQRLPVLSSYSIFVVHEIFGLLVAGWKQDDFF